MFALTCKEFYYAFGYNHLLLANTQRGLPNDQIVYSCCEYKYWDLMVFLIDEMHFPFDDGDDEFYEMLVQSQRVDLIERFGIPVKEYAEVLGREGTEEIIDYALQKGGDISAVLCDVALHGRIELLEKLMVKYQKKISILNKLAIATCGLDLENIKLLIRHADRLSGKELDVITYSLDAIDEYSDKFRSVLEWFMSVVPVDLDLFIDPPEVEEDEEDDHEAFSTNGILFNVIYAGNVDLLMIVLEKLSHDPRFLEVLPIIAAKITLSETNSFEMLQAVCKRFPKFDLLEYFNQMYDIAEFERLDDIQSDLDLRIHKNIAMQLITKKNASIFKCLKFMFDFDRLQRLQDRFDYTEVAYYDRLLCWVDTDILDFLRSHGVRIPFDDYNMLGSLLFDHFARPVCKYFVEKHEENEKLKGRRAVGEDGLEVLTYDTARFIDVMFYTALGRCDVELLKYLHTKLDSEYFKKTRNFVYQFIKFSRDAGGLVVGDFEFQEQYLDDDRFDPRVCIDFIRYCMDNGGTWLDVCNEEVNSRYFQGYYKDELLKFMAEFPASTSTG